MQARYLTAGDVILQKGKRFVIRKIEISDGKVKVETTGGHLTFNPTQFVEVE